MKLGEVIIQIGSDLSIDGVHSKILNDKIVTSKIGVELVAIIFIFISNNNSERNC